MKHPQHKKHQMTLSKALAATIGGNYETLTDADKEL